MKIQGCSAIITGGASGLGAATARLLMDYGAKVTIFDTDEERGAKMSAEIGAKFIKTDVRKEEDVSDAIRATMRVHGVPRILVNCAGIAPHIPTLCASGAHALDAFRMVIDINLTGTFICASRFATILRQADPVGEERGVIINIASIAAFDGQSGLSAYAASKAGVVGLTLPLARDLAAELIRVVAIAPGVFDTPMISGLPNPNGHNLGTQVPHPARLGIPAEFAEFVRTVIETPMLNGEVVRLDGALRLGAH